MSQFLVKIILAILLGSIIGFQRTLVKKQAGLKTFSLVALGSCLFVIFVSSLTNNLDSISRVLANIVLGIGFLGSGIIFSYRGKITGLTTAAALWVTASIGMGVGLGFFKESIIATLIMVAILEIFFFVEKIIQNRNIKTDK